MTPFYRNTCSDVLGNDCHTLKYKVKSRQKRIIIDPAKLMKYNQYEKDMTLVDLLIDGMFSLELLYINICIWLYHFM